MAAFTLEADRCRYSATLSATDLPSPSRVRISSSAEFVYCNQISQPNFLSMQLTRNSYALIQVSRNHLSKFIRDRHGANWSHEFEFLTQSNSEIPAKAN